MGLHSGLTKRSFFCTRKILPWACQTGVLQSSTRSRFPASICKSACIQFIFPGGDAPSVLDCTQIVSNKPLISPFWVLCSCKFLNGWALPKSLINNDAHNRPFCTSARLQPIFESSWFHTIHFYIPHHLSRRRCSFRAGLHANCLKQTTNFPLLGALFMQIFEWMGAAQVIDK